MVEGTKARRHEGTEGEPNHGNPSPQDAGAEAQAGASRSRPQVALAGRQATLETSGPTENKYVKRRTGQEGSGQDGRPKPRWQDAKRR